MLIALAVQMHRFLIDTLHELGFCSSYREVLRYERNAPTAQNLEIPESNDEIFVQFMADNVDHNSKAIDGLNTFHGTVIMAAVNSARKYHNIIPSKTVLTTDIVAASMIGIHYKQPCHSYTNILTTTLVESPVFNRCRTTTQCCEEDHSVIRWTPRAN